MDRLTSMSVFVTVVDQGSFSAAAEQLQLSRATISKHIAALENCLGGRLLNRTTRRISLTEAGKAYYEHCRQILEDVVDAECVVTGFSSEPRGRLRINAPMSFGTKQFADIVAMFCQAYPDIDVELSLSDRFVNVVEEGYDLAIRITQLKESSLVARKLAPCRVVLCASPDYLKTHGRPVTPDDLEQHTCLHYAYSEAGKTWVLNGPDGEYRIRIHPKLSADNGDVLCTAARQGLGITLLPTFIVGDAIRAGDLDIILPAYQPPQINIYAVYASRKHLSAKVRAFIDFAVVRIGEKPIWDLGV
ncbi:MAG TPA: LysR family transcriptional regulator [Gammaproteobacteria bacterium]|nr:LysR family transcriptional regulator [Gammaproteobacteria bacterium]